MHSTKRRFTKSSRRSAGLLPLAAACVFVASLPASSLANVSSPAYVGDVTYVSGGGVRVAGQPVSFGGATNYDTHHSLHKIHAGDLLLVPVRSAVQYVIHAGKRKAFCDTRGGSGHNGNVTVTATAAVFMKFASGQTTCGTAPNSPKKTLQIGNGVYAYIQHDPVFEVSASTSQSVVKVRRGLLVIAGASGKANAVVVGKNEKTTVRAGQDPMPATATPPAKGKEKTVVQQVSAPLPPPPTDSKGPATTLGATPPDPTSLLSVFFTFSSEANATFSCALDDGAFRLCSSPLSITVAPGPHTLQVEATDTSGNTGKPTKLFGWTVQNSLIAFTSNRDGKSQIYTVDPAGNQLKNISDGVSNDYDPAWSPDGKQIVFHSDRAGPCQIFVKGADGGNVSRVTLDKEQDTNPAWSRTGRVAYESDSTSPGRPCEADTSHRQHNDIFVSDVNGANRVQLTNDPADDIDPSWSPDGTHIAFASNRSGSYQIYVMSTDGKGVPQQLTNEPNFTEFGPAWSPDGKQIAFNSTREGNSEIFVMNADGSNQRPVARSLQISFNPTWAPDGMELAFQSQNDQPTGPWRIYWSTFDPTASLATGGAAAVTGSDYSALTPDWSPAR